VTDSRNLFVLAALAAGTCLFAWTGFLASDDGLYLAAAGGWLSDFPFVGESHWSHRHTVVLPMAAALAVFGSSEAATIGVAIAWYAALVLTVYGATRSGFGPGPALATAGLAAMTPSFALQSTVLNADLPEATFALLALALFWRATRATSPGTLLFCAGVALGFAILSRITALGLGLLYGLLFLRGAYFPRSRYWIMAGGCALVVGLQMLFFAALTGDPLHMFHTALSTHGGSSFGSATPFLSGSGNLSDDRFLAPPLALLVNQEFGLLFWAFLPAAFACWRGAGLTSDQRGFCRLLIGMAALWFLWIGYGGFVRPLPRYFSPSAVAAVIVTAIAIRCILWERRRHLATLAALAIAGSNFLAIDLDNKQLRFGERTLASYAATIVEPLHVNPRTAYRAEQFLAWAGPEAAARIAASPPPPGALFFQYESRLGHAAQDRYDEAAYRVLPDWKPVWKRDSPRSVAGWLLQTIGLDAMLPASLANRLVRPGGSAAVYRTPPASG
jgi:4-amino-4-deoxy-L-arabinose transferase-like glycosyltransferase